MLRARNIKPGFFQNENIATLPFECRLLYIGLWCYADREGRFEWRPKRIKALIFPYDNNIDIDKMLHVITCNDMVRTYNDNKITYGYIPTFKIHNNPHPHEKKSKCPAPPSFKKQVDKTNVLTCNDMSVTCNADIMNPDIMNNKYIKSSKNKRSNKKSKVRSFDDDSYEIKLSKLLFNLIKKRDSKYKIPNWQNWAYEIDKLIRLDKRNPEEIEKVIRWCQKNTISNEKGFCWANNILSTKKLRAQYGQLWLKMNEKKEKPFGQDFIDDES